MNTLTGDLSASAANSINRTLQGLSIHQNNNLVTANTEIKSYALVGISLMNLFQICEIAISYDPKISPSKLPKINSSDAAHDVFRAHWKDGIKHVESFYILLLNRANHCIGIKHISTGGLAGTVADPKVIMQTALSANASSLVLAHNHPSDNTKPSQNDIDLTKKLKSAGQLLDIQVLDHLILGWESYYSFADESII